MDLDAVQLSRWQFGLTIMFHYLFPPLSIGLGTLMVFMEGTYLRTRDPLYQAMTRFWTGIFAVNFALGVATGLVMEFQFGTNWATYSRFVGDVFGSALAAEGIFAFFLESGFLAVLVFGWDRVTPRMHFIATVMVALGSIFSAVWIVVANSWQQTPAGYHLVTDATGFRRAEVSDFWGVIFNPSTVPRLVHTLIGSFILGAFVVMSVSAWYLLRRRHEAFARKSFTLALAFGTFWSLAQLAAGHFHADQVARTQPAKLAAIEGHFHTGPADMHLFGAPDPERGEVRYALAIPGGLSLLVHGNSSAPVTGLDQFAAEDRPPVAVSFYSYHLMVLLGLFFIALTLFASYLRWRGTLFTKRWLLWVFVVAVLGPYAANQAGWVTAEVGRQPWIVYGLLRTGEAASKAVRGPEVVASIVLFGLIYALLFAVWVFVLNSKIQHGPDEPEAEPPATTPEGLLDAAARRISTGPGYSMTATEEPDG
jgi:cytochrome d ubiquinol oxidase subunit I